MKQKKTFLRIVSMVLVLALVFAYSPVAIAKKAKITKLKGSISNKSSFSKMKPGDSATISLTGLNVKKGTLKFTSSDTEVCKVEKNGKVTAGRPGKASIAIESKSKKVNGKITLKVSVVAVDLESVKFKTDTYDYVFDIEEDDPDEDPDDENTETTTSDPDDPDEPDEPDDPDDNDPETLDIGEETEDGKGKYKLVTKPYQINDDDLEKFEWTSSDPSVGTVNEVGQVTFYKWGTTTITATYKKNPKLTASIVINAGPSKEDPEDEESDPDDPEEDDE